VNVQWTATPGGDHYTVERWTDGVLAQAFTHISGTSFYDNGLTTGKTYVYRMKAFDATEEGSSPFSAWDLATVMAFNPIVPGTSVIRFDDIDQLLIGLNSVRWAATDRTKSAALTWSAVMADYAPATPVPSQNGFVYANHILALRKQMDLALAAVGIPPPSYAAVVAPGQRITAEAWLELQRRAQ